MEEVAPVKLSRPKRQKLKKILVKQGIAVESAQTAERNRKIELFVDEFIKNGGNATKATMKAFNMTNRASAQSLGSNLLKEVRGIANIYLETKGASYGKLLDTAVEKMKESKTPEWWDRLMKISGHEDFISKEKSSPVAVNIINSQKDFIKGYVEEGEVIDGDED